MAEAKSNDGMFSNKESLKNGDIEQGRSNEDVIHNVRKPSATDSLPENMANVCNYERLDDLDRLVGSLTRKLEDVPQYMCIPGHAGRISRIPRNLREVNVKAYEPYFLSIGPYHHGKARLERMEKKKRLLLKYTLEKRPELTLKDYLTEIKSIEPEARSFYSEVEMDSEKFVQMLLLDSLYLVATFCGIPESRESTSLRNIRIASTMHDGDKNGRINRKSEELGCRNNKQSTQIIAIKTEQNNAPSGENSKARIFSPLFEHDLFLLENQLPFFLLQKMHEIIFGGSKAQFTQIMKDRVGILLSGYTKLDSEMMISPMEEVHHLLHLCHLFFRPTFQQQSTPYQLPESSQMFRLGSAVQLYDAGVSFEARSSSAEHCLLDIKFTRSGKLVMPCLHVDDNTDSLLRNLIALEQMKFPSMGLDVSAYAVLLLHLVTTPDDVALLRRKRIIEHHLASDKEMMYLVNRLSVGLSFDYVEDRYSLKPIFHELRRYTEHRAPRWKAWLKHRHFSNPWTVISLLVGFVFLFLTALQTYYTVYSYYFPCFGCHS